MSDSNTARKTTARQTNASHYEMARAYAKDGFYSSVQKASTLSTPESKGAAALYAARTALAGSKSYGKSLYHAGMGSMEGFMRQNPNDGRNLNNMKISQALEQGRTQAANKGIEGMRNQAAKAKTSVSQSGNNKGIEAVRQKAAAKPAGTSTSKSTNQGIASYQSKAGGKPTGTARSGGSSAAKSSGASGGKSGGSSSGGQSSGGGQGR